MIDLSPEEIVNLVKLAKRAPITGEEALPVALLIQKLESALQPQLPPQTQALSEARTAEVE